MSKNVGTEDTLVRIAIGGILLYLGFASNPILSPSFSKTFVGWFSLVPLVTGIIQYCPLYTLAGINTRRK